MTSGIYKITSPSGKFYIGSAVDIGRRWRKHRNELTSGVHHCKPLANATRKYGITSLRFEVLTECQRAELIAYEQAYIDLLKPSYNVAPTAGSLLGFVRTNEMRLRHSVAMRSKWQEPGHRAKVSLANTGKVPSAATRAKMSDAARQRVARDGHPRSKPVECIELGKRFASATEAALNMNLRANAQAKISAACIGVRKSAYGYHWKFVVECAEPSLTLKGKTMSRIRMVADDRKKQLIEAGYEIARDFGIRKVTRAEVARRCSISDGLINRYCAGREGLRFEVMEHAAVHKDVATLVACAAHYELPPMPQKLAAEVKAALKALE
jgi:group I intron endonuclease